MLRVKGRSNDRFFHKKNEKNMKKIRQIKIKGLSLYKQNKKDMMDLINIIRKTATENITSITYNGVKITFRAYGGMTPIDVNVLVNDDNSAKLYKKLRKSFYNASVNKVYFH